jgi:hypothetical protein
LQLQLPAGTELGNNNVHSNLEFVDIKTNTFFDPILIKNNFGGSPLPTTICIFWADTSQQTNSSLDFFLLSAVRKIMDERQVVIF